MSLDLLRRAGIATRAFMDIANWREVLPKGARGEAVTEIRLRDGTRISAPPENALWPHFSDVWYHLAYTKYCPIPKGGVVIDIGANVGTFSLFAAKAARVVLALEPATANFKHLARNVAGVEKIVALNVACGAQNGSAALDLSTNPVSFSLVSSPTKTSETVKVITLGELLARYGVCDFLKMDCEGSEFGIILDSAPIIFKMIDRIVMEYHDYLSPRFSHRDLVNRLTELGFQTKVYNQTENAGMLCASKRSIAYFP